MTITEKSAYIKGLVQGLQLDANKSETKILDAIIDLLSDVSLELADLQEYHDELAEQVDAIDEDLCDLEEAYCEDEDDDGDDDSFYELKCPNCGEEVYLPEAVLLKGEMPCPSCGENLEFDFEDICGDNCDCDCDGCSCTHEDD